MARWNWWRPLRGAVVYTADDAWAQMRGTCVSVGRGQVEARENG
jgi:hypothetical protein